MRALLLAISSGTLILGLWAGSNAAPIKQPPGPLIQARIEAEKLSVEDRERILPLIEQARDELMSERRTRRFSLNVVYVSGFIIGIIGVVAGARGPRKKD